MSYGFNPSIGSTHRVIIDAVPPGSRVLDVGCASGYLGHALAERGCKVWGIDRVLPPTVQAAGYEAVAEVDLDETPPAVLWPDHLFDCIVAADVLEHLADPDAVLQGLLGRLTREGRLIVSLPNVANLRVRIGLLLGRFDYTDTGILDRTHRHLYTYASARRLVERCGAEVTTELIGSDRFGAALNRRPWAARALRGLLAYSIILVGRRIDAE